MSKPKGLSQGPHKKSVAHIKSTGEIVKCGCGCGEEFPELVYCNGRVKSFVDARHRQRQQKRDKGNPHAVLTPGQIAGRASAAKRKTVGEMWRNPKFAPSQVCHNQDHFPTICRDYSKCSDQSIIGQLWEHEANGFKPCWNPALTVSPGQLWVNNTCRINQRSGARKGAE